MSACGSLPDSRSAEALANLRRKSVLDTVRSQTAALKRLAGLDADERLKLARMEESIRSVERRLDAPPVVADTSSCAEVRRAMETGTPLANSDANYPQLLKLHLDLIALALELDVTRVITISLSLGGSGGAPMQWLQWKDSTGRLAPIEASHHNVTHGMQRGVANRGEKLEVIDRWNFEQFAYLVGKLKAIHEAPSNVLDSSILWYSSDVGDGGPHSSTDMPFIVAGRAGGALRTGRYLAFADRPKHQRLLTDFCNKLGVETAEFGRPGMAAGGSLI